MMMIHLRPRYHASGYQLVSFSQYVQTCHYRHFAVNIIDVKYFMVAFTVCWAAGGVKSYAFGDVVHQTSDWKNDAVKPDRLGAICAPPVRS